MKRALQVAVLIFVFLFSTGVLILASKLEKLIPGWRPEFAAFWGLALGTVMLVVFKFFIGRLKIQSYGVTSKISDVLFAVAIIVGIFSVSVSVLHSEWSAREEIKSSMLIDNLLYQVRPAYGEEVGFRYGLANLTFGFYGAYPALIAGTIPFGLIHLSNFATGEPIQWDYILGVTAGGLFLTLMFLNFNLAAAVIVHYVWNFMAFFFSKVFGLSQERLEGAPVTLILLLLASGYLFWRWRCMAKKAQTYLNR